MSAQAGVTVAIVLAVVIGGYKGVLWLREDAVRDFMTESALKAAEKARADQDTKDQITEEIDNATIDELRARAVAGGMFSE